MDNVIASNKKANFNYQITDTYEAGIVLSGPEVKSVKQKEVSLSEAHIKIENGEAWIKGMSINPWKFASLETIEEMAVRDRKLLLNRKEIDALQSVQKIKGVSIIPIKLYVKRGKIKLLIGLGKGLKKYDKRAKLKDKEINQKLREKEKVRW